MLADIKASILSSLLSSTLGFFLVARITQKSNRVFPLFRGKNVIYNTLNSWFGVSW